MAVHPEFSCAAIHRLHLTGVCLPRSNGNLGEFTRSIDVYNVGTNGMNIYDSPYRHLFLFKY